MKINIKMFEEEIENLPDGRWFMLYDGDILLCAVSNDGIVRHCAEFFHFDGVNGANTFEVGENDRVHYEYGSKKDVNVAFKRNILASVEEELKNPDTNAKLVQGKAQKDMGKKIDFFGYSSGILLCVAYYIYKDSTTGKFRAMSCAAAYNVVDENPVLIDRDERDRVEQYCSEQMMVPFGGCLSFVNGVLW